MIAKNTAIADFSEKKEPEMNPDREAGFVPTFQDHSQAPFK
jgi:hypothetical protein